MKRITVLNGSRRKNGNTATFVKKILDNLSADEFRIEYIFPQDYTIMPCSGCGSCFNNIRCVNDDGLTILQNKILTSDLFIIASPVYLHYMTADLKLILDKCSWWTHTFRLCGKPSVILSTCDSNGHKTVLNALSDIITYMGGNVIATANASQIPPQLNNEKWLNSVATEIAKRIEKFAYLPPQSNAFLEKYFVSMREVMLTRSEFLKKRGVINGEVNYWERTGMVNFKSFAEYLSTI